MDLPLVLIRTSQQETTFGSLKERLCGNGPFGDLKRRRDLSYFGMTEGQASPTLQDRTPFQRNLPRKEPKERNDVMGTRNPLSLFREEEMGRKEPIGGFRSQGPSSSDEGTKEKNARETTRISQNLLRKVKEIKDGSHPIGKGRQPSQDGGRSGTNRTGTLDALGPHPSG